MKLYVLKKSRFQNYEEIELEIIKKLNLKNEVFTRSIIVDNIDKFKKILNNCLIDGHDKFENNESYSEMSKIDEEILKKNDVADKDFIWGIPPYYDKKVCNVFRSWDSFPFKNNKYLLILIIDIKSYENSRLKYNTMSPILVQKDLKKRKKGLISIFLFNQSKESMQDLELEFQQRDIENLPFNLIFK